MLLLILLLALVFLLIGSGLDFDYLIPKRFMRLVIIVLGSVCLAVSSIVFQTIVGNRILSPSIMGYEAVYLLWQALLLLVMGTNGLMMLSVSGNFIASIMLMLVYSWALHRLLLPRCKSDVFMLLLFGLVLTMVIGTVTQFIQLRISPGEFSVFQGLSYTSFNRSNPETVWYGVLAVVTVLWVSRKTLPVLDVMALGREAIDVTWYQSCQIRQVVFGFNCHPRRCVNELDWPHGLYGRVHCQYSLCACRK